MFPVFALSSLAPSSCLLPKEQNGSITTLKMGTANTRNYNLYLSMFINYYYWQAQYCCTAMVLYLEKYQNVSPVDICTSEIILILFLRFFQCHQVNVIYIWCNHEGKQNLNKFFHWLIRLSNLLKYYWFLIMYWYQQKHGCWQVHTIMIAIWIFMICYLCKKSKYFWNDLSFNRF